MKKAQGEIFSKSDWRSRKKVMDFKSRVVLQSTADQKYSTKAIFLRTCRFSQIKIFCINSFIPNLWKFPTLGQ